MSDAVIAAMITVGGMTTVAVISVISQFFVTRFVIRAEDEKQKSEHAARLHETKTAQLTETLAELLSETDPQTKSRFSYERVVTLIHRAQLLLDRTDDQEAELCSSINHLGLELQEYIPHHSKPTQERLEELLRAHAKVADLGGQLLQSRPRTN